MSKTLQIEALEATGGLVSETPVEKEVDWYELVDGKLKPAKYTVHVLQLPFKKIEDVTRSSRSVAIGLISEGILLDGGQTRLTQAQAERLAPELTNKLIAVFNEVNGTAPGAAGK
jgi:hypothetical protein